MDGGKRSGMVVGIHQTAIWRGMPSDTSLVWLPGAPTENPLLSQTHTGEQARGSLTRQTIMSTWSGFTSQTRPFP